VRIVFHCKQSYSKQSQSNNHIVKKLYTIRLKQLGYVQVAMLLFLKKMIGVLHYNFALYIAIWEGKWGRATMRTLHGGLIE
jgi:hypothetical protein